MIGSDPQASRAVRFTKRASISRAGLDVFVEEPLPTDHPLTGFDQLILSPHIAGVTEGASERMAVGSAQNILDFFDGRLDPDLIVNKEALDAPET